MNRTKSQSAGFSLAELLVVISVIAFLLAMAAPNIFSLMRSSTLSTQGDMFRNRLTLAQQQALSTNSDVEVRFYKFKDANNAQPTDEYRAMQFFQYNPEGQLVPISETYALEDPLLFSEDMSSILSERDSEKTFNQSQRLGSGVDSAVYQSFRFLPDGSTDLNMIREGQDNEAKHNWYITMIEERPGQSTAEVYNYFSIQIDPYNGSLRVFRP